jgi:hypothetical protein
MRRFLIILSCFFVFLPMITFASSNDKFFDDYNGVTKLLQ